MLLFHSQVENEHLLKEVKEKQDLLCEASKALTLLDEEKSNELQRYHMSIDEFNQKIESLQHEVTSLQNALVDANKSNLGNDTGFTDFLGAVDSKDIDCQRKMFELNEIENSFKKEKSDMNNKIVELQRQKNDIEMQLSGLLYENDEIKDKFVKVEKIMHNEVSCLKSLNPDLFREPPAATTAQEIQIPQSLMQPKVQRYRIAPARQ
jgi:uncharacterized coiled-coil DUF342 family protein